MVATYRREVATRGQGDSHNITDLVPVQARLRLGV